MDVTFNISLFRKILENKCETEKRIALKSNRMVIFHNKWKTYEELLEESLLEDLIV